MNPAENFGQLRLRFTDPIQHEYEIIRPIMLFGEMISERSRQAEIERTRIGEKARRFVQQGMFGLVDQRTEKSGGQYHQYPEPVAVHILYLKHLYPPIGYREIVRIIERKFNFRCWPAKRVSPIPWLKAGIAFRKPGVFSASPIIDNEER